jgi:hypothetical protein
MPASLFFDAAPDSRMSNPASASTSNPDAARKSRTRSLISPEYARTDDADHGCAHLISFRNL